MRKTEDYFKKFVLPFDSDNNNLEKIYPGIHNAIYRAMEEFRNQYKWMPISESLPDFDEVVLWYHESGNYTVDSIDKDESEAWWTKKGYTHYQKLTSPE